MLGQKLLHQLLTELQDKGNITEAEGLVTGKEYVKVSFSYVLTKAGNNEELSIHAVWINVPYSVTKYKDLLKVDEFEEHSLTRIRW